jgi:hypothetical protein
VTVVVRELVEMRAELDQLLAQTRQLFSDDTPATATKFRLLLERDYRRACDRLADEWEREFPQWRIRRSTDPRPLP